MTTITITKENFGKKMSLIYNKVNLIGKVRLDIDEGDNWDEFSLKNRKAWFEAKKDLDKGDTISFENLKAKYM